MAVDTVVLRGSPRRGGNSDALADMFAAEARGQGAEVVDFALSELSYKGCVNLFHCKTGGEACGQVDDLTPVLAAVATAQVLVLASPVYFTSVSGQMKLAIDRFFSFFVPDYPTAVVKTRHGQSKHLVFLQTQGEPEGRYGDLMESFEASFKGLGYEHRHLVRAWGGREAGDVVGNDGLAARCGEVAGMVYG